MNCDWKILILRSVVSSAHNHISTFGVALRRSGINIAQKTAVYIEVEVTLLRQKKEARVCDALLYARQASRRFGYLVARSSSSLS